MIISPKIEKQHQAQEKEQNLHQQSKKQISNSEQIITQFDSFITIQSITFSQNKLIQAILSSNLLISLIRPLTRQQLIAILYAYKREAQDTDEDYFERDDYIVIEQKKYVLKLQYIPKQLLKAVTDYTTDYYFSLHVNINENEFEYLEKAQEMQQKNTKTNLNVYNSQVDSDSKGQIRKFDQNERQMNPISYIAHINFVNLKIIEFVGLLITNVEPVTFINMPNIECLNLIQNEITSIKVLSKMYFNHECHVRLSKSLTNEINFLGRFSKISFYFIEQQFNKASIQQKLFQHCSVKIQRRKE